MKIRVGIDRFTDLRSKIRQAFERGDDVALDEAAEAFFSYMHERWTKGVLSLDEKLWLSQHPKFENYLEHRYEDPQEDWGWRDIWGVDFF